jgi:hypothetical protein
MSLDVRLGLRPRPFTRPRPSASLRVPSSTTNPSPLSRSPSRRAALTERRSPFPPPGVSVAEVLQTLVTAIAAITKKRFDESKVFEHYGMICLALDDIVVDGHVESVSWDQIRRTAKMKLAAET